MRRSSFFVVLLSVVVLFAAVTLLEAKGKAGGKPKFSKGEPVEKTGVIEVTPSEGKQKFPTVTLKVGADVFKVVPGKGGKNIMKKLEALNGKTVTLKGNLLPANPPKHPMAAIKVESFTEGAVAAPAAPASAAPAAPAGQ